MAIKRKHEEESTNVTMADRLTNLPESLQIHILSSLETKHAIQTSLLSKSWASTWTHVPVLSFSSYGFEKLRDFDKFVFNTLSVRGSGNLDKLIFKRSKICSARILNKVFDYAFSQGVKELEVSIIGRSKKDEVWPIFIHTTWDSLTSLKLDSNWSIGCSFLGPRSGAFKNLTDLHLVNAIITDLDPFSGFPALKKLTLVNCHLSTDEKTLNVHAPQLLELTITYYMGPYVNRCELTTPNLRYFECCGTNFPRLQTNGGLPVLDTVVIDYMGSCSINQRMETFDDLMMMFSSLQSAKSLTIFSPVFQLLSYFPQELAIRRSPFWGLKCLKLDFSPFHRRSLFQGDCSSLSEVLKLVPIVKAYLLPKSDDGKCTIVYPDGGSACSSSRASKRCTSAKRNVKRYFLIN